MPQGINFEDYLWWSHNWGARNCITSFMIHTWKDNCIFLETFSDHRFLEGLQSLFRWFFSFPWPRSTFTLHIERCSGEGSSINDATTHNAWLIFCLNFIFLNLHYQSQLLIKKLLYRLQSRWMLWTPWTSMPSSSTFSNSSRKMEVS